MRYFLGHTDVAFGDKRGIHKCHLSAHSCLYCVMIAVHWAIVMSDCLLSHITTSFVSSEEHLQRCGASTFGLHTEKTPNCLKCLTIDFASASSWPLRFWTKTTYASCERSIFIYRTTQIPCCYRNNNPLSPQYR